MTRNDIGKYRSPTPIEEAVFEERRKFGVKLVSMVQVGFYDCERVLENMDCFSKIGVEEELIPFNPVLHRSSKSIIPGDSIIVIKHGWGIPIIQNGNKGLYVLDYAIVEPIDE